MADRPTATGGRRRVLIAAVVIASFAAACGGSGATPPPSTGPGPTTALTPTPTPDRHVLGTLDTNRVFQLLVAAGAQVHQESLGGPGSKGEPVVILYLIDGPVHVAVRQYSTSSAVAAAGFKAKSLITKGDAPYELWTSNMVIDIGPSTDGVKPAAPDADTSAAATAIVAALDGYIGPFQQRAVAPLTLPSTPAPASPSASPAKPS